MYEWLYSNYYSRNHQQLVFPADCLKLSIILTLADWFIFSLFPPSLLPLILNHKNGHQNPLVSPEFILFFLSCNPTLYQRHYNQEYILPFGTVK